MNFKLCIIVTAFLIATGCTKTANITLGDEITSRGMINRAELALGQVYLWNRAEDSATRLITIGIPSGELAGVNRNTRDVEANLSEESHWLRMRLLTGYSTRTLRSNFKMKQRIELS